MQYFVLDVETCPIQLEGYESLPEEEQKKMLNPIDSKVIAIGLRHENTDIIFLEENEKILLQKFWNAWASLRQGGRMIVGFNITQFDIPFLIARSFINNVYSIKRDCRVAPMIVGAPRNDIMRVAGDRHRQR